MNVRRVAIGTTAAAVIVAAGVVGGFTLTDAGADKGAGGGPPRSGPSAIMLSDGLDLLASQTAEDWVSYASVVGVVTVVDERANPIPAEDRERGEGVIGRKIDLRIDEALWTRAGVEVPELVTLGSEGWAWSDGDPDKRTKFGGAGRPRLEVGEQYLVALAEFPGVPADKLAQCEDEPAVDEWGVIGQYGSVPVTDGVVGAGEFEGARRNAAEALKVAQERGEVEPSSVNASFRGSLYGKSVAAATPALDRAAEHTPPKKIPVPGC